MHLFSPTIQRAFGSRMARSPSAFRAMLPFLREELEPPRRVLAENPWPIGDNPRFTTPSLNIRGTCLHPPSPRSVFKYVRGLLLLQRPGRMVPEETVSISPIFQELPHLFHPSRARRGGLIFARALSRSMSPSCRTR